MSIRKENKQTFSITDVKEKIPFELSPFNESKFNKWKQDMYWKDEKGYFKGLVVGHRFYYDEQHLLNEYTKLKTFCEDPNDEYGFKNFKFGFKYDLYF